jgi:hypothetical protein
MLALVCVNQISLTIKPKAMKKIILFLSMSLALATTSVFANPDPVVSEEVLKSFNKEFAGSQVLDWSQQGEYMKATFILAGFRTVAYFSADGRLEGSIRNLFYNQLPLNVITAVDKRFESPDVIDVSEISNPTGTTYRLTLESKSKKYRVKTDSEGNITDIERLKK